MLNEWEKDNQTKQETEQIQKIYSFHLQYNAFHNLPFLDNINGINGSCAIDLLHQFKLGSFFKINLISKRLFQIFSILEY